MILWQLGTIRIFIKKSLILIRKPITTRIIRRININHIHLTLMRIIKASKSVIIITFYEYMSRFSIICRDGKIWYFFKNRNSIFSSSFKSFRHIYPMKSKTVILLQLSIKISHFTFQFFNFPM